jgi:hypothetical protein
LPPQTPCIVSQRVFIFTVVYFVIDSVRKRLDTPSYDQAERRTRGNEMSLWKFDLEGGTGIKIPNL